VSAADISVDPDVDIYRWVGPGDSDTYLVSTHHPFAISRSPFCKSEHEEDSFAPPPISNVVNDMFVYATHDVLGFGSGGGGFALRLDETLEYGASRPCATYGNKVSLLGGRENFPIQRVQVWTFSPQFW
jgi:hypothetical protein